MISTNYTVTAYRPGLKAQVIDLLRLLWGDDRDANHAYFQWKYEANPVRVPPAGVVAVLGDDVVGFRGYFASRFETSGGIAFTALMPGDLVVDGRHRGQGLSVDMGNFAKQQYAPACRLFLNTSCTVRSLGGNETMGFRPLAPRAFMTRASVMGLLKYGLLFWSASGGHGHPQSGRFGAIEVSLEVRASEMAQLIARSQRDARVRLLQDEEFFRWRFANPRGRYVFYYTFEEGELVAYLVAGISPNDRRAYILDYAGENGPGMEQLLTRVVGTRQFDLVSIHAFCLPSPFLELLRRQGFRPNGIVRRIERRLRGELPLLIHPGAGDYTDADFIVDGLDLRRIENWALKPICSDYV